MHGLGVVGAHHPRVGIERLLEQRLCGGQTVARAVGRQRLCAWGPGGSTDVMKTEG